MHVRSSALPTQRPPEAEVRGACELSSGVLGNKLESSARAARAFNL